MECGCDAEAFWKQTPRLFHLITDAKLAIIEREKKLLSSLTWHGAALARAKEMPSHAEFLGDKPQVVKQTPAEMKARFAAMREAVANGA